MRNNRIRPLALYLPQYHTIPENDVAWGKGFTEWTNVRKAQPLFEGHYQPHVPHPDVGYYDLRDSSVMVRQAAMARENGIYGFAYYHYWFNGTRLLNDPLDNMLKNPTIDMPFCYVWANENWTKRWDGQDNEVIIAQHYSKEDDMQHIRFLCERVFSDSRYIKIDNKPLFIVYRTELLPDVIGTAALWRSEAKKYGFEDLFLVRVESFLDEINPADIGFDAAMEFAPNWREQFSTKYNYPNATFDPSDYWLTVLNMLRTRREYLRFRCVYPAWDNTARKGSTAKIFMHSNPAFFHYFLQKQVEHTIENLPEHLPYLFINAWNEWGEGCHLEPDELNQYAYLNICKKIFLEPSLESIPDLQNVLEALLNASNERIEELIVRIYELEKSYRNIEGNKINRLRAFISRQLRRMKI